MAKKFLTLVPESVLQSGGALDDEDVEVLDDRDGEEKQVEVDDERISEEELKPANDRIQGPKDRQGHLWGLDEDVVADDGTTTRGQQLVDQSPVKIFMLRPIFYL